jgi:uncharacterized protein YndB with AHSA1/START domain
MLKIKPGGFQFIQQIDIDASPQKTWKALINIGGWFNIAPGEGRSLKLEPWAGGRFYSKQGDIEHLNAIVTYIEPHKLIRFSGQMGMSHLPVISAFIFQLEPKGNGTLLKLCHRCYGMIDTEAKQRYSGGWKQLLAKLKAFSETGKRQGPSLAR